MNAPLRINPYLTGNFGPLGSGDDIKDLKIVGEIPASLCGTFSRNGPNPQFVPRDPNHHWFAGDGMLHALEEGHQPFEVDPTALAPRGYRIYAGAAGRLGCGRICGIVTR